MSQLLFAALSVNNNIKVLENIKKWIRQKNSSNRCRS